MFFLHLSDFLFVLLSHARTATRTHSRIKHMVVSNPGSLEERENRPLDPGLILRVLNHSVHVPNPQRKSPIRFFL